MKYRITITKIETVKKPDTNWEKLYDKEPFEALQKQKGYDRDIEQYGYRTIEVEKEESKQVYDQVREEEIDLMAVITAFNK